MQAKTGPHTKTRRNQIDSDTEGGGEDGSGGREVKELRRGTDVKWNETEKEYRTGMAGPKK